MGHQMRIIIPKAHRIKLKECSSEIKINEESTNYSLTSKVQNSKNLSVNIGERKKEASSQAELNKLRIMY